MENNNTITFSDIENRLQCAMGNDGTVMTIYDIIRVLSQYDANTPVRFPIGGTAWYPEDFQDIAADLLDETEEETGIIDETLRSRLPMRKRYHKIVSDAIKEFTEPMNETGSLSDQISLRMDQMFHPIDLPEKADVTLIYQDPEKGDDVKVVKGAINADTYEIKLRLPVPETTLKSASILTGSAAIPIYSTNALLYYPPQQLPDIFLWFRSKKKGKRR